MSEQSAPEQSVSASVPSVDDALDAVVGAMGGERRDGQHAMANTVAAAIGGQGHAIVQAGTGTGKSLGYLVPAALHTAGGGKPVIVATATLALQKQLVERELPRLAATLSDTLDHEVSYAVLKGRNNYVCLNKLHGSLPDDDPDALFDAPRSALGEQAVAVRAWAEQTQTGDRDEYPDDIDARVWRGFSVSRRECVGETRCPFGEECFTVKRRMLAAEADIVVTNHAMLAIDALEGIPLLPEHDAVVIDEGHELVDRATAAVTAELSATQVERAITRARRVVEPSTLDRMHEAHETLDDALRDLASDMQGPTRVELLPKDLELALSLVRDAFHDGLGQMSAKKDTEADAAARQLARAAVEEVHDVAGSLLALGEHDVAWLDPGETRAPTLRMAPLSVAGLLRDALFSRSPVVVTSATLTVGGEFTPVTRSFGLDADDVTTLDVGSPFDHGKQGILYVAKHLERPGRDGIAMEALDELADLIEAAGGRTLALFSSWRGVEKAAEYLRVRLDAARFPLLVQRRGDAVGVLVEKFAADPASSLLGTVSLWQGVDVPGPSCSLVVIDRIPFPRPDDPLLAARQRAVDEAGGSGFQAVSVPRAGLLLAQGAGRLIRGVSDRGVVAVLDSRLATAGYGRTLRGSLPPFWFTTDRATVLSSLARLREELDERPT